MPHNDSVEGCNSNCAACSSGCEHAGAAQDLHLSPGPFTRVQKVIGVLSGKGGVGKSLVTSLLACALQTGGYRCGILDADVTGPSIPKAFGLAGRAQADERGLLPRESKLGIQVMSVNLLLEKEDAPVVWRGPVISGVIQQFWQEVAWGELDFLLVDMPPGTGDVSLTVFQRLPLDGLILVTTPQDLVGMIVRKAYNMAQMLHIPVLGIVENMSYTVCPDCGREHHPFGKSKLKEFAQAQGLPVLAKLPLEEKTAELVDKGAVELADTKPLDAAVKVLTEL